MIRMADDDQYWSNKMIMMAFIGHDLIIVNKHGDELSRWSRVVARGTVLLASDRDETSTAELLNGAYGKWMCRSLKYTNFTHKIYLLIYYWLI